MSALLLLALVAFVTAFTATPLVRTWSLRYGVVDRPDGDRKLHRLPVPRTGGIAIFFGCIVAGVVFMASPWRSVVAVDLPVLAGLAAATMVVFLVGLLDDLIGLNAPMKFSGQIVAACLAYYSGVEVLGFAGFSMHGWWSLPVTVIWLVACANAFNLIDGVDGLAAGIGLVACLTTLFAALIGGNLPLALATAPLAGALVAFLRYNFNPASIFLGDCGSLTIGFVLGCCGAIWSQKATTLVGMLAPLMALSVPLLDTALALVRRFMRHQPLFRGDRNHIHHRLLDKGFTPRDVFVALCGMGLLTATFALIQTATHSRYSGLFVVAFGVAVWLAVRSLGYLEFTTARYLASTSVFRHMLDVHVYLRFVEGRLSNAGTPEEFWSVVRDAAHRFGFVQVTMTLDGQAFEHGTPPSAFAQTSHTRIPLPGGAIEFVHPNELSVPRAIAANALGEMLQRVLETSAVESIGQPAPTEPTISAKAIEHTGVDLGIR